MAASSPLEVYHSQGLKQAPMIAPDAEEMTSVRNSFTLSHTPLRRQELPYRNISRRVF